ncbi:Uncharacterized protein conserved in bacteria [hydrothermal vent metagenome]|uniref:Uncharacterized protein conserved in bacteria n=1 Tax=hydrothermal vent metagenome TaxID=652676 RepID=A0A3B1AN68_9ZZZZ
MNFTFERFFSAIYNARIVLILMLMILTIMSLSMRFALAEISPVGLWKTIDDSTGRERSIVKIWKEGDVFNGKIIKILNDPRGGSDFICSECEGELYNKPIIGLTIIRNMKKDEEKWSGGEILDPENGIFYNATMSLDNFGKILEVRGFVGFSFFGRSQFWTKVSNIQ